MNTKEEIIKALEGTCDGYAPPAVFTQTATVSQMGACGCTFPYANTDPLKMSTLALQMSKQFGFAMARVPYCLTV
ncbi:MAG: methylcobamide--CoM methyltransferase, partial [Gammaproteobacteria bacterium]|nr:methylcobamide--CoM methyltransferase [Gammaproteobacteria bacterium]